MAGDCLGASEKCTPTPKPNFQNDANCGRYELEILEVECFLGILVGQRRFDQSMSFVDAVCMKNKQALPTRLYRDCCVDKTGIF